MAKTKIEFVCRECGSSHHQWAGQCLDCKEWNTLEEAVISQATSSKPESLKDLPSSKVQNLSEINRVNKNLGLREITKINLNLEENLNQKLTDGDMIFVPSITGLNQSTVALSGQFKYPGKYSVKNGEKLSSLLKRA